ncbi:MAG: hypothetical protein K9K67_13040 [Bacteriovoracaceae bacterium]|nr:hypothetical protein [Bacteriovoracaceae bacterium]
MNEQKKIVFALILLFLITVSLKAGPTVVGNGDDGRDLEGFVLLKEGKIVEARDEALKKLENLNIKSVPGLGSLIPELKNSPLYITKADITTEKLVKLGAFTNDESGLVYARTFPRPYSATRFFPASKGLAKDQIISLHIHEALHRALPENIRDNEPIVSDIALAITTPETTFDQINSVVAKYLIPVKTAESSPTLAPNKTLVEQLRPPAKPHSRIHNPSRVSLGYISFADSKLEGTSQSSIPVKNMYRFSSHLYPFGGEFTAVGIGIDANFLKTENDSQMGPLGISFRYLAWTVKEFDIELFGRADLNSLSNEELQNSLLGRDVYKIGLTLAKRSDYLYIENDLEYTFESDTTQTIGNIEYNYGFGSIIAARMRFGGYVGKFNLGGFGEFLLSDNFTVEGGAFKLENGRNRLISGGPEIQWRGQQFGLRLYGRYLLASNKDTDYEFLGDLHGRGVGQGNLGIDLNFFL